MKLKNNFFKLIGITFLSVGIVFFLVAVGFLIHFADVKNNYIQTDAVITGFTMNENSSNNNSHKTNFIFIVDGEAYSQNCNAYSTGWKVGDIIKIYYNPENPEQTQAKIILTIFPSIFGSIGTVFIILGGSFLIFYINKKKLKIKILSEGRKIYGNITGFSQNKSISYNLTHPYILYVEYTDAYSTIHYFKSENIWISDLNDEIIGKQIDVYYIDDKMSKYYVDTDSFFITNCKVVYH